MNDALPLSTTVIVCVLDDWRVLRTLSSLASQTVPAHAFDVVVVSSGSEDIAAAVQAMPLSITHIVKDVRLPVARNLALEQVQTESYLTIDADCIAHPGWVEQMTVALTAKGGSVVGVGGRIAKHAPKTLTQRYGITIDDGQAELGYLPALHLPYVTGANAGFLTDAVKSVGGYDEQFRCGEDVDICYKLGLAGGELEIAQNAWVYHEDRRTLAEHYRRFRHYAIDQALLFKKYREHSGRRYYIDGYPARRAGIALRTAARGIPDAIRGDFSGLASGAVTAVEAAGIKDGELRGAFSHKIIYL
jgi:glycosyltransferase involved in cell wall biosynthesis